MGAKVDSKSVNDSEIDEKKNGGESNGGAKSEAAADTTVAGAEGATVWENPLVPNVVLREMYRKMVEVRLLEEYARKLGRRSTGKSGWKSIRGREACRVSVAQGLESGDLVLESQPGAWMGYLLGAELDEVLRSLRPGPKVAVKRVARRRTVKPAAGMNRLLPLVEETEARLFAGLGAALLLKSMKRMDGVVIYLEPREVGSGVYRRALTFATSQELAVFFFVLPDSRRGSKAKSKVIAIAHDCRVPAMTVEASDAIALYRVVQESVERFRAGGGPVLIEGVAFSTTAGKKGNAADPIAQLGKYLLDRKVSTKAWMGELESSFRKRLSTAKRA